MVVINDEKDEPFGQGGEGGGASAPDVPSEFGFYSILALDMSDSIFNNDALDSMIDGAHIFINKMVNEPVLELRHHVAILVFGRTDATKLVLAFTDDADALHAKLEELRGSQSLGSTNLYGAYMMALQQVMSVGSDIELVERSLVILTDGTHESGAEDVLCQQALDAKKQGENTGTLSVFSIGIKGNYAEEKLEELASKPDYFVLADNASSLEEVFKDVAESVEAIAHSNYVVGVCTPVELGSPSLTIKVNVDGAIGDVTVGYPTDKLNGDLASCNWDSIAKPCKDIVCGSGALPGFDCGTCEACGMECVDGSCTSTACQGKDCGDDGCGGSCGACQVGWQCGEGGQCFDPCLGKECGDDGYGGSCGTCGTWEWTASCEAGTCVYHAWLDDTSGLTWQDPPSDAKMSWSGAMSYCENLELDGGYWHLPAVWELRTLIRGCWFTADGGSCNVSEYDCLGWSCWGDSCAGCTSNQGPADGCYWPDELQGACDLYWTSHPDAAGFADDYPILVDFSSAELTFKKAYKSFGVRCVRW